VRGYAEGIGLSAWSAAVDDGFVRMEDKFTLAGLNRVPTEVSRFPQALTSAVSSCMDVVHP